jgi:glycosyltransferase involved in cell wall biosynthesis
MKVFIALPGLHSIHRGAEVAFESLSQKLSELDGFEVTLAGSGAPDSGRPYRFLHTPMISREWFGKFPKFPPLRSEIRWEEMTFAWALRKHVRSERPDITVTCSYPFVSWALRGMINEKGKSSQHVFVTQNGDYPAHRSNSEFRWFHCDGLVCTNPRFHEAHKREWNSKLIPNGVDLSRFKPGADALADLGFPKDKKIVLMASALIPSKNVTAGVKAVALLDDVTLAIAGDGPCRDEVDGLARKLLPERYIRVTLSPDRMPDFYRSGDVFLHLSQEESFGNVYIEAMACGTPVVAHDYSTTHWILGNHASLLDTSDPRNIAATLQDVLQSPVADKKALHQFIAERFSWDAIANEYAGFFEKLEEQKS